MHGSIGVGMFSRPLVMCKYSHILQLNLEFQLQHLSISASSTILPDGSDEELELSSDITRDKEESSKDRRTHIPEYSNEMCFMIVLYQTASADVTGIRTRSVSGIVNFNPCNERNKHTRKPILSFGV